MNAITFIILTVQVIWELIVLTKQDYSNIYKLSYCLGTHLEKGPPCRNIYLRNKDDFQIHHESSHPVLYILKLTAFNEKKNSHCKIKIVLTKQDYSNIYKLSYCLGTPSWKWAALQKHLFEKQR